VLKEALGRWPDSLMSLERRSYALLGRYDFKVPADKCWEPARYSA
jgi:hypothetical protein